MYNAGLVWPRLGKGRVITTISDSDEYIRSNSANRKCLKNLNSIRGNILVHLCHLQSNPLIKYTLLFWQATNILTDLKVETCANLIFIMVETKLETWNCT